MAGCSLTVTALDDELTRLVGRAGAHGGAALVGSGRTYVLLHGEWHGGWCWARVADGLRAQGHRVFTPTQTGLGERRHLLSRDITLDAFVDDIANADRSRGAA